MKIHSRIVLLSGQQGSGKTSAQKKLIDMWNARPGHKAIAINFADALYEMHFAVQAIAQRYGIEPKKPKDGPLLQVLGTQWGRHTIDENIWVIILKGKIKEQYAREGLYAHDVDKALIVIGDCRFENEFEAFPEALRVRLICNEDARKLRCSMWRENTAHESEVSLDRYDTLGKFDLYVDTGAIDLNGVVDLIDAQLKKNVGKEKRDEHKP
jgi:hypothetical protein